MSSIRIFIALESVEKLGRNCFMGCNNLEEIILKIGSNLKFIKSGALYGTKLKVFYVPRSVEQIEYDSFSWCKQLKRVIFAYDSIFDGFKENCFNFCNEDLVIEISKNFLSFDNIPKKYWRNIVLKENGNLIEENNMIIEKHKRKLLYVRQRNQEKLIIPKEVNEIDNNAFKDLKSLKELQIWSDIDYLNLNVLPFNVETLILNNNNIKGLTGDIYKQNLKQIIILGSQKIYCNFSNFEKNPKIINKSINIGDEIDFNMLVKTRMLGKGVSGDLYLMINPIDRCKLVVRKIFCNDDKYGKNKMNFERELLTMKLSCHPCIVKFYGNTLWKANDEALIAFEYYSCGSLENNMENLNNTEKVIVFIGTCLGMSHLHDMNIIHRNLKPQNILIDEEKHPHIGDFGLSNFEKFDLTNPNLICSPMYMAPELFNGEYCGFSVDVYAFGALSFELLFGTSCFSRDEGMFKLLMKKNNNDHAVIPVNATPLARKVVESMISVDASNRPTFAEIMELVQSEKYSLLPDIDVEAIKSYISKINKSSSNDFNNIKPEISELIIDFNVFENKRIIERGNNGNICLMTNIKDDRDYVIKERCQSRGQNFIREIDILVAATHPCTVKIYGFCFYVNDENPARIAFEFYENKTLFDLMDSYFGENVKNKFTPTLMTKIIIGICYGMRFLHNHDIIHRNLSPKKIFLDSNFHPKIGGFNKSNFIECDTTMAIDGIFGSDVYVAPEACSKYDSKVDVYSFGIILYELITNRWLKKEEEISKKNPPLSDGVGSLVTEIIEGCLESDPSKRFSFNQIVDLLKKNNFKLFDGIDLGAIYRYFNLIELYELDYYHSQEIIL